jgi:hypothetical protein
MAFDVYHQPPFQASAFVEHSGLRSCQLYGPAEAADELFIIPQLTSVTINCIHNLAHKMNNVDVRGIFGKVAKCDRPCYAARVV